MVLIVGSKETLMLLLLTVLRVVEALLGPLVAHQQKNEKLRYIAFFPSETQILNFVSQCFS